MAAAVTLNEMNTAMAPMQTELNRLGAQVAAMVENFNRGGQALVDDAETKKAELRTLNDMLRRDTQAAFESTRNEIQMHRAALENLPIVSQELIDINVRHEDLKKQTVDKFKELVADVENRHLENEKAHKEIVAHVKVMEVKVAATTATAATAAAATAAAAADPAAAAAAQAGAPDPLQYTAWAATAPAPAPGLPPWTTDGAGAGAGGKGGRAGNPYFPQKKSTPETFYDKAATWRSWRDDVSDYFDNVTPGLSEVLAWIHAQEEAPSLAEVAAKGLEHGVQGIAEDRKKIWRSIKQLTGGVARQVVQSVKDEDGWLAWHRLAGQFEPSLVAMRGEAIADIGVMARHPSANPLRAKTLLTDFLTKRR